MPVIGEYAPDGSIAVDADVCAVTGVPILLEHHVQVRLDVTHFVRRVAGRGHQLTPERRAELLAMLPAAPEPKKSSPKSAADTAAKES